MGYSSKVSMYTSGSTCIQHLVLGHRSAHAASLVHMYVGGQNILAGYGALSHGQHVKYPAVHHTSPSLQCYAASPSYTHQHLLPPAKVRPTA